MPLSYENGNGHVPLNQRVKFLEEQLLNPDSECYLEGLLDVVTSLAEDTRHLAKIKSNRLLNNIHEKFKVPAKCISEGRLGLGDFECIKRIGKGAFGEVQLVRHSVSRQVFALKILSKSKVLEQPGSANFWEERDIMAKSRCDWIVRLFYAMQDLENLYMVMEYVPGGNLNQWIDMGEDMAEEDAMFYIAETILGLEVLHGLNYIHRDIKPSNLLLDRNGHVKLADFGAAIHMDPITKRAKPNTAVGTPDYLSPEVLKCQGNDNASIGAEVDWWAVGVMIYELVYSELPFYTESLAQTYNMIMNHKQYLRFPDSPGGIPKETLQLMKNLIVDADIRLGKNGAFEIKQHAAFDNRPWKWDNIHHYSPPFVPQLQGDADTSRFDLDDDDGSDSDGRTSKRREADAEAMKRLTSRSSTIKPFTGEQLSFAGFTFIESQFSLFQNHNDNNTTTTTSGGAGGSSDKQPTNDQLILLEETTAKFENERKRWKEDMDDLELQLLDLMKEQEALASEKKTISTTKTKLECEIQLIKKEMESIKSLEQEQRARADDLHEKMDRLNQEIHELQNEKSSSENKIHNLKNQLNESQKCEERYKNDGDELRQRVQNLQQDKESLQQQFTTQRSLCNDLQKQLSDKNCELVALQAMYERTKQEVTDKRDKEQLDKRLQDEQFLREELESKKLELEKLCQRLELDVERLNQNLTEIRKQEEENKIEINRLQRENESLQRQHQQTLTSLHGECERLREMLDSETNFKEIYRTQMEEREDQCKELTERCDQLKGELIKITKENDLQKLSFNEKLLEISAYQEKLQTESENNKRIQRQQADAHKRETKAIEEELMEQQGKHRQLQQQFNDVKIDLEKRDMEVAKLSKDLKLALAMKEASIKKLNEVIGESTETTPSKASTFRFRNVAPNSAKMKNLQNEVKKLQSRLDNQMREHKQRRDEMADMYTAAQMERDELQKQIDILQQQNDEMRRTNAFLQQQPYRSELTEESNVDKDSGIVVGGGSGIGGNVSVSRTPSVMVPLNSSNIVMDDDVEHLEGVLDIVPDDKPGDERKKKRHKLIWESKYGRIHANENMLAVYDSWSTDKPLFIIRFEQIMHVRSASQADVLHVDKKDICRIFQIIVDFDVFNHENSNLPGNNSIFSGSSHSIDTLEYTSAASSTGGGGHSIGGISSPLYMSKRFTANDQQNSLNRRTSIKSNPSSISGSGGGGGSGGNIGVTNSSPSAAQSNLDYNYKHHKFQDMYFRSRATCHVCNRSLNSMINPSLSLQCLHCHLKICPSHVEVGGLSSTTKSAAVPPCGSKVHMFLLRAPSPRMCERWVGALSLWIKRKLEMSIMPPATGGGGGGSSAGHLFNRSNALMGSSHYSQSRASMIGSSSKSRTLPPAMQNAPSHPPPLSVSGSINAATDDKRPSDTRPVPTWKPPIANNINNTTTTTGGGATVNSNHLSTTNNTSTPI